MPRIGTRTCIALAALLALSSCATDEASKAKIGAVIGGLVGAAFGAAVSKDHRVEGALLGAAIGAGAGYVVGQSLDERDRAALRAKVQEMAERPSTSGQTVWQSDHSGASATISAEPPTNVQQTKRVTKEPDVAIGPTPLQFATGPRLTTADVNVRQGPGTQHPVKDVLRQGLTVNVMGMTDDGWYLVGRGNTAFGYVSGRYLQQPGERRASAVRQAPAPVETKPQAPRRVVEAQASPTRRAEEVDVRVAAKCRPVRVRIRAADGSVTEETTSTCQNPDGSWGA